MSVERLYLLHLQKLYHLNRKLYWAKRYHRNTRGERMSFRQSPFLVPIYEALNTYSKVAVIKSVQSGISEALIISHLEEASRGLSILYVLPKTALRNTFVQNRLNRVLAQVPFYHNILRSVVEEAKADSVHIKIFGKGVIKYVDSNSKSNFVEFPADAVYLDEKDRMNQPNIEMAPDRLSASRYRYEREVSNPTVEDYGIHARWTMSTQGVWHIKCEHCNTWQHPDWLTNVVREIGERQYEARDKEWLRTRKGDAAVLCIKCGKPLDRFAQGEYVHKHSNRLWKGFHVNKLFGNPLIPVAELLDKFETALRNDTKLQIFFNSDLGLPYASSSSKLTETALNKCCIADYFQPAKNDEGLAVAGIDVGTLLHVVIRKLAVVQGRERKLLLYAGTVRKKEDIVRLFQTYNVKSAVVDAQPETRLVESLQEAIPCMYKCFFHEGKNPVMDKKTRTLTVDRTTVMDEVKENVDYVDYANYANMKDVPDYYEHLQSNTRVYNADSNRFEWVQSSKADHFFLTEVYTLLALKLKLASNIFEFFNEYDGRKQKSDNSIEKKATDPAEIGKSHSQVMQDIMSNFYGKNKTKGGADNE